MKRGAAQGPEAAAYFTRHFPLLSFPIILATE